VGISKLSLGSPETKWHLGAGPMAKHRKYYKGEGGGFAPKFKPWWVLWVRVCPWLIHAPKCSNYALTNLLFGLCKSTWVSKLLVNLHNPIPKLQYALSTPKVLWIKECALIPSPSVVFTFGLTIESIKELGVRHKTYILQSTYGRSNHC
jgi:hypothetical protein